MLIEIQKKVASEGITTNEFEIYHHHTNYDKNNKLLINFQENETPIDFFKRVINSEDVTYLQINGKRKIILFEHCYTIIKLIKEISSELEIYFTSMKNLYYSSCNEYYNEHFSKYYNDYQNAISKINKFLNK